MKRASLMLIAALAMVVSSFDAAEACNRSSCCRAPRTTCCPTSHVLPAGPMLPDSQMLRAAQLLLLDKTWLCPAPSWCCCCCCGAGVVDGGMMTQPTPAGDVMYEGSAPMMEGDVIQESAPVEAPAVPDAPAAEAPAPEDTDRLEQVAEAHMWRNDRTSLLPEGTWAAS